MADPLSAAQRSELMSRIRAKDTRPELTVRRLVHRMGLRFRLHVRNLPGCPDLVFPRLRKVVFVHGCFWHRHPNPECKLTRLPKSRAEFWRRKLEGNRHRDRVKQEALLDLGWRFLVIWECELRDIPNLVDKLRMFLVEDEE
ncbi:very short patch repair endonuclease [Methylomagnum sp.]